MNTSTNPFAIAAIIVLITAIAKRITWPIVLLTSPIWLLILFCYLYYRFVKFCMGVRF